MAHVPSASVAVAILIFSLSWPLRDYLYFWHAQTTRLYVSATATPSFLPRVYYMNAKLHK